MKLAIFRENENSSMKGFVYGFLLLSSRDSIIQRNYKNDKFYLRNTQGNTQ